MSLGPVSYSVASEYWGKAAYGQGTWPAEFDATGPAAYYPDSGFLRVGPAGSEVWLSLDQRRQALLDDLIAFAQQGLIGDEPQLLDILAAYQKAGRALTLTAVDRPVDAATVTALASAARSLQWTYEPLPNLCITADWGARQCSAQPEAAPALVPLKASILNGLYFTLTYAPDQRLLMDLAAVQKSNNPANSGYLATVPEDLHAALSALYRPPQPLPWDAPAPPAAVAASRDPGPPLGSAASVVAALGVIAAVALWSLRRRVQR